jgi:hypothetical protein
MTYAVVLLTFGLKRILSAYDLPPKFVKSLDASNGLIDRRAVGYMGRHSLMV